MATMIYQHHQHQTSTPTNISNPNSSVKLSLIKSASMRSKRKSAVELLAESKPLYVKSECVRDREQSLPQRQSLGCSGGYTRSKSIGTATVGYAGGRQQFWGQVSTVMMPQQYMAAVSPSRSLPPLSHHHTMNSAQPSHHRRTIHSSTALITSPPPTTTTTTSLGYQLPPPLLQLQQQPIASSNNNNNNNNSDLLQNRLRQLLVNCTPTSTIAESNSCMGGSIGGTVGSSNGATGTGSMEDVLLSVEQLGPLSPPAEYATTCVVTDRSGGGGGGVMAGVGSQRCHKSLPDLHCRGEPSSNKSSNKSLSNRDSGGSSGHYTQHSEPPPPPRQEVRRDSGSSTQHSGASSYYCCQEAECRAAARAQQQAYAAAAMAAAAANNHATYQPTMQPTQQLQQQQLPMMQQPQMQQYNTVHAVSQLAQMNHMLMQRDVGYSGMIMGQMGQQISLPVQQQPTTIANSLQPPVTFKRQKCLRYKRDRPILRSKSDISDRYWRPPEPPISHLEQFFEHLGLTSDRYEDMFSLSGRSSASPVFFSDVSTVDSSAPIDTTISNDYTNNHPSTGGCTTAAFRPNEPPSIVERNARIIKWLCHCRKAQML